MANTLGSSGPNQSRVKPDVIVILEDGDFETKLLEDAVIRRNTFIVWDTIEQKYLRIHISESDEIITQEIPEEPGLSCFPGIKVVATTTGKFDDLVQFKIVDYPEALTSGYVFAILDGVAVLLSPATNQPE